jgi:hypothetical protein
VQLQLDTGLLLQLVGDLLQLVLSLVVMPLLFIEHLLGGYVCTDEP